MLIQGKVPAVFAREHIPAQVEQGQTVHTLLEIIVQNLSEIMTLHEVIDPREDVKHHIQLYIGVNHLLDLKVIQVALRMVLA